jgi:hypothetical protein
LILENFDELNLWVQVEVHQLIDKCAKFSVCNFLFFNRILWRLNITEIFASLMTWLVFIEDIESRLCLVAICVSKCVGFGGGGLYMAQCTAEQIFIFFSSLKKTYRLKPQ